MRIKRLALVGASLALMGGMTAACGGSPTDASVEDFCTAYENVGKADGKDAQEDAVKELEDVGTPEDIPDDARKGFEFALDVDEDAKPEDFNDDELKEFSAFTTWAMETCSDAPSAETE